MRFVSLQTDARSTRPSNAKRIGAPVLDRPLDIGGLRQFARQRVGDQTFQLVIGRKAERDYLACVKGASLLAHGSRKNLLVAKFFFEPNESILHSQRVQSNQECEDQERQRDYDPPAGIQTGCSDELNHGPDDIDQHNRRNEKVERRLPTRVICKGLGCVCHFFLLIVLQSETASGTNPSTAIEDGDRLEAPAKPGG